MSPAGMLEHGALRRAAPVEAVRDEGRHHLGGERGIVEVAPAAQIVRGEGRPALRHVEAAVGRETGEEDVFEGQRGRAAAGAYVTHGSQI